MPANQNSNGGIKLELREKSLASSKKFNGKIIQLYVDEVKLPNGRESRRELVRHPGASAVLVAANDGKIILERQYRYPIDEIIWEIPAGKLDENEKPDDCAKRELREETGFTAKEWKHMGHIYTTPGFSDEKIHLFFAKDIVKGESEPDADELVEIEFFEPEEVERMIKENVITDAKTIAAFSRAKAEGFVK